MVCGVYHFVDDFLILVVINLIKAGFVEWNIVGHVVDAGGVGGIVVCVWFVQM